MNAYYVDNNRHGRHPGKGNNPAVLYRNKSTDLILYVGMAEHSYRGLLEISGGIRHERRGSDSED